jgi:hypothetical protein
MMNSRKINYRSILVNIALLAIPIALVTILYPSSPVIQVPRLGLNGMLSKNSRQTCLLSIGANPLIYLLPPKELVSVFGISFSGAMTLSFFGISHTLCPEDSSSNQVACLSLSFIYPCLVWCLILIQEFQK